MIQYCRYCNHLVTGNGIYCDELKKTMSEVRAKHVNQCNSFEFNPLDAFGLDKTYNPREPKKKQCDGQISLFGEEAGHVTDRR